jgi:lipopolysaccharide transport system ATP-binding protein
MSIILKADNISKQYRLGSVGTGTLGHDLNRWWASLRGKEDPFLKVGVVNDRSEKSVQDYVWALRDINFEVQSGEVLGIIGKNGAGKSTLLKILSRVTSPTTGSIKTRGRIASLLEVGTGFHGELTGRENIFMNGAVLGMTKSEIKRKLDEIIDFSGCEMYIDTPVKRYSSGMTVRLGFAVAAHLEPEILVVDEVLAVGDAEFQKKAVGKMQDLSTGEGRTVLFVSHNMTNVQNLCSRAVLLNNGRISKTGKINDVVNFYLERKNNDSIVKIKPDLFDFQIKQNEVIDQKDNIQLEIILNVKKDISIDIYIDLAILNKFDEFVVHYRMNYHNKVLKISKGINRFTFNILDPRLTLGEYSTIIYIYDKMKKRLCWIENASFFRVSNDNKNFKLYGPVKSDIIHEVDVKIH